jgi:hypothetical protein
VTYDEYRPTVPHDGRDGGLNVALDVGDLDVGGVHMHLPAG